MAFSKAVFSASVLLLSLLAPFTNAAYAIKGATGGVHPRYEIRQLYRENANQWNLYLLALYQFYSLDQNEQLSYFQISGIHGVPAMDWDGVPGRGTGAPGYCNHGTTTFPLWHRPYLALFEQELQKAAVVKAKKFSGSERTMYLNLASTLRLPFFDWAAAPPNGNAWPLIYSQKYVTVHTGIGDVTIINPMFRYNFHPKPNPYPYDTPQFPWRNWDATLRYATSNASNAVSQNNLAAQNFNRNRNSIRQSVYNFFNLCPTWNSMSDDGYTGASPQCSVSLEGIHNNIHLMIGGYQTYSHMTIIQVSASDPSFWGHHAMIDRLVAMWQAIYPGHNIGNQPAKSETYTIREGDNLGPDTPLAPFHDSTSGSFWTCRKSLRTETFGYVYPEFADSDGSVSSIKGYINRLYGPNANAKAGSSKAKRDLISGLDSVVANSTGTLTNMTSEAGSVVGDTLDDVPSLPAEVTIAPNGTTYQYIANVQFNRWSLGESYTIFMFFGEPSTTDTTLWPSDPQLAGFVGVFAGPGMEGSSLISTNAVPLTDALTSSVASGALETLAQPLVINYLQKNLAWRIVSSGGKMIDPDSIPNFLISVVSSTASVPESDEEFPEWSEFHLLTQITAGKIGGAHHIDQTLFNPANQLNY